jgi:hypothetical protein
MAGALFDLSFLGDGQEVEPLFCSTHESNGSIATAPQAPLAPTLTLDAEFPEQYAYEVLIFDLEGERRLVAAVEIVSPANKDRGSKLRGNLPSIADRPKL